jgi:hypothetical protein
MARTATLRQLFEEGVHKLTHSFNGHSARQPGHGASEQFGSRDTRSASSARGQVSAFALNPVTLERKMRELKKELSKVGLVPTISEDAIKHIMQKSENDGLSAKELVRVLAEDKKLKPAAPKPTLAFRRAMMAPG